MSHYLIVGTKAEYTRWIENNRPIWLLNPELHISTHTPEKLRGYDDAKVIICESAWSNSKHIGEIVAMKKYYEEITP